jgi:hypothetical protein
LAERHFQGRNFEPDIIVIIIFNQAAALFAAPTSDILSIL